MTAQKFKPYVDFAHRDTIYKANVAYQTADAEVLARVKELVKDGKAKWIGLMSRVNGRGVVE